MRLSSWTGLLPVYKPKGLKTANVASTIRSRILLHQNPSLPQPKHWQIKTVYYGSGLAEKSEGLLVLGLGNAAQPNLLRGPRHYKLHGIINTAAVQKRGLPLGHINRDLINDILEEKFIGTVTQIVPEAKHTIEVKIHAIQCTSLDFPNVLLDVSCSGGTDLGILVKNLAKEVGTVMSIKRSVCDEFGLFRIEHALPEHDWQPEQIFETLKKCWYLWDNSMVSEKKRKEREKVVLEQAFQRQVVARLQERGLSKEEAMLRFATGQKWRAVQKSTEASSLPREEEGLSTALEEQSKVREAAVQSLDVKTVGQVAVSREDTSSPGAHHHTETLQVDREVENHPHLESNLFNFHAEGRLDKKSFDSQRRAGRERENLPETKERLPAREDGFAQFGRHEQDDSPSRKTEHRTDPLAKSVEEWLKKVGHQQSLNKSSMHKAHCQSPSDWEEGEEERRAAEKDPALRFVDDVKVIVPQKQSKHRQQAGDNVRAAIVRYRPKKRIRSELKQQKETQGVEWKSRFAV